MIRSIERLCQRARVGFVAPAMLLVATVPSHPDPVGKRASGYAGIIPIPASSTATQSMPARIDPLLDGRRDTRAERGRVLYAAGHAPRDTAVAAPRRRPCPEQRVGQAPSRITAPNS